MISSKLYQKKDILQTLPQLWCEFFKVRLWDETDPNKMEVFGIAGLWRLKHNISHKKNDFIKHNLELKIKSYYLVSSVFCWWKVRLHPLYSFTIYRADDNVEDVDITRFLFWCKLVTWAKMWNTLDMFRQVQLLPVFHVWSFQLFACNNVQTYFEMFVDSSNPYCSYKYIYKIQHRWISNWHKCNSGSVGIYWVRNKDWRIKFSDGIDLCFL